MGSRFFRAYSFCAVFLFRFINRNRNRRVQKERLSFERNNFHGNKMVQCLISNWKGKKYENIPVYENEIRKKNTDDFLDRLLSSPTALLLRSFSSVFERVFMVTGRKWRAAAVLTAVLVKEKSGEKDAEQVAAVVYFDEGECAEDCFSRLLKKTRKETKTSMFQHKKKNILTHLFVVVSPSNFRRVVGFPPTVNRHKPR